MYSYSRSVNLFTNRIKYIFFLAHKLQHHVPISWLCLLCEVQHIYSCNYFHLHRVKALYFCASKAKTTLETLGIPVHSGWVSGRHILVLAKK